MKSLVTQHNVVLPSEDKDNVVMQDGLRTTTMEHAVVTVKYMKDMLIVTICVVTMIPNHTVETNQATTVTDITVALVPSMKV